MSADCAARRRSAGVTLVEMIMYMVIVSVGVAGILSVMTHTSRHSADPMIRQQALLVAEAYMQEILISPVLASGASTLCRTPPASRADFGRVCDYNGLNDTGAKDQKGNAVSGLELYNVAVTVSGGSGISLGPTANAVSNIAVVQVLRVDVNVSHSQIPGFELVLTGYRTNFDCNAPGNAACVPLGP